MKQIWICSSVVFSMCMLSMSSAESDCPVDPQYWCNSEDIARSCGVLEVCKVAKLLSNESTAAPPVTVDVYYESYCPDSKRFIVGQLYNTWAKLLHTGIFNPVVVPFGKATFHKKPDGTYSFTCQHGAAECTGNMIENCVIKHSNQNASVFVPIIYCMSSSPKPDEVAQKCVEANHMNWQEISSCAMGKEGNTLLMEAGVKTQALKPALNWVPWIVLNGVHTQKIQNEATTDLFKLVCESYQGKPPAECGNSNIRVDLMH